MERILSNAQTLTASEPARFYLKSAIFLAVCSATLFIALASSYPAIHDLVHNGRHALAIVPCH